MTRPLVFVVLATAVLAASCGTRSAPILGAGPFDSTDGTVLDDALNAARTAGYRPTSLDPESGRFELVARSDGRGRTRFVVQCYADGYISIFPVGPDIHEEGDRLSMPERVRAEYGTIAIAIDEAVAVTR